jgi:hypothetical protein
MDTLISGEDDWVMAADIVSLIIQTKNIPVLATSLIRPNISPK